MPFSIAPQTAPDKPASRRNLHVLVVDDSAVVRQVMTTLLSQERGITVSVAADPIFALEKMKKARPDVIVLDLEMPRMDGITFLRRIMASDPIPVVVCSGLALSGTEVALNALEEGAVAVLTKPQLGVREFLHESAVMLIDTVAGAADARLRRRHAVLAKNAAVSSKLTADAVLPARAPSGLRVTTDKVVAIGASTGGTEALRQLLQAMPPDGPGIVIVQHMPEIFTAAFAKRLNESCAIEVKEAANGDRVLEGRALIAPGNRHTMLRRSGGHYIVEVAEGPLVSRHRPSVDVLFRSVAQAAGPNAVGVILTGMGDDGAAGMLEMKQAGAFNIAQDEASCVVFGMPKEAITRGGVDDVKSLSLIPSTILRKA